MDDEKVVVVGGGSLEERTGRIVALGLGIPYMARDSKGYPSIDNVMLAEEAMIDKKSDIRNYEEDWRSVQGLHDRRMKHQVSRTKLRRTQRR